MQLMYKKEKSAVLNVNYLCLRMIKVNKLISMLFTRDIALKP